jgi:hypothetical protein
MLPLLICARALRLRVFRQSSGESRSDGTRADSLEKISAVDGHALSLRRFIF